MLLYIVYPNSLLLDTKIRLGTDRQTDKWCRVDVVRKLAC